MVNKPIKEKMKPEIIQLGSFLKKLNVYLPPLFTEEQLNHV